MHKRTFKKGTPIFKEGEKGLEAYLIESGKVLIVKKGPTAPVIVAALPQGTLFGEMAILDGSPRMATAIAGEDTVCVVVNSMQMHQRLMSLPPDILRILTGLMEYVRSTVPFDQRAKIGQSLEPTPRDQQAHLMLPTQAVVDGFGLTDPMLKALVRMLCDYTRRRLPPALVKT
ncbi:MAG: cyclic nucleotide-binding domain-containing protein [Azospirillum sp.]|nr:cyclic nucleotide-binding domain-containing protein [Azospirillum sp.]